VKVKEKYFETKYNPTVILLNYKATIYFKFKLQLKVKHNNIYSSVIVSFHAGLC